MKKLFIYYYVGGSINSYNRISLNDALKENKVFKEIETDQLYFRRDNLRLIEKLYKTFTQNDPLLDIITCQKKSYLCEVNE